jgi:glycosyltransferase involved in cell wall biosynthesis
MGIPVLASDIPANVQLLEGGKYGALFRCGSVESMAQALDLLLDTYEISIEKSRLAKDFFVKRTWLHCAQEYDSLFRKLHSEKGSA